MNRRLLLLLAAALLTPPVCADTGPTPAKPAAEATTSVPLPAEKRPVPSEEEKSLPTIDPHGERPDLGLCDGS